MELGSAAYLKPEPNGLGCLQGLRRVVHVPVGLPEAEACDVADLWPIERDQPAVHQNPLDLRRDAVLILHEECLDICSADAARTASALRRALATLGLLSIIAVSFLICGRSLDFPLRYLFRPVLGFGRP